MPIAVIAFDFDPLFRFGPGISVRWQTLALAVAVLVGLAASGVLARRRGLRADDLIFVAIGAAPGAILGGRLGYALLVPEAFAAGPISLFDPSIGGLELGLAVVGGLATAAVVAALLGAPSRPWAHIATIPLLAVLGGGKLAMALGGSGQGRPFDGDWATAYLGPGPWVDAAAGVPSHPSQVYEAIGVALVALIVLLASSLGLFRLVDGRRLLVAIGGWSVARAIVSVTWRDAALVGDLPTGGVIAATIGVTALIAVALLTVWLPRRELARAAAAEPHWPDPETRPPF